MAEVKRHKRMGIPLDPKAINNTLRQANKVMSEKLIRAWLDKYSPYLFWRKGITHITFLNNVSNHMVLPQIYLHEFLCLTTNATNRLEYVKY